MQDAPNGHAAFPPHLVMVTASAQRKTRRAVRTSISGLRTKNKVKNNISLDGKRYVTLVAFLKGSW